MLEELQVSFWVGENLEDVLIWSETAKAGSREQRRVWQKQGVNLFVHNVGSAQLYDLYAVAEHLDNDIDKTKETSIYQLGSPSGALSNNADISEHDALNTHTPRHEIIRTLIATHGLIGQYIRGEIPYLPKMLRFTA